MLDPAPAKEWMVRDCERNAVIRVACGGNCGALRISNMRFTAVELEALEAMTTSPASMPLERLQHPRSTVRMWDGKWRHQGCYRAAMRQGLRSDTPATALPPPDQHREMRPRDNHAPTLWGGSTPYLRLKTSPFFFEICFTLWNLNYQCWFTAWMVKSMQFCSPQCARACPPCRGRQEARTKKGAVFNAIAGLHVWGK